jgi:uncharacterized repeat protein (TIGR03803 family)
MAEGGLLSDIASFDASGANGWSPLSRVTFDSAGNVWGTTELGGADDEGTVWEIPKGSTTIQDIAEFHGVNGAYPEAGVTIDSAGNVYGTASRGGSNGYGVVWEIPASTIHAKKPWLSVIATFIGGNGIYPMAGVTIDATGNLWGTAEFGGSDSYGVVWEIPASTIHAKKPWLSVIATFILSNGAYPQAGVTVDRFGNLYGTAYEGGSDNRGVVWEIPATSGTPWLYVIANFNVSNGDNPLAGVTVDKAFNLWGTAAGGGTDDDGVIWEIPASTHSLSVVANFNGLQGIFPRSGVTIDSGGNLIGTAEFGGFDGYGVVWEVHASTIGYTAFGPAQPE